MLLGGLKGHSVVLWPSSSDTESPSGELTAARELRHGTTLNSSNRLSRLTLIEGISKLKKSAVESWEMGAMATTRQIHGKTERNDEMATMRMLKDTKREKAKKKKAISVHRPLVIEEKSAKGVKLCVAGEGQIRLFPGIFH